MTIWCAFWIAQRDPITDLQIAKIPRYTAEQGRFLATWWSSDTDFSMREATEGLIVIALEYFSAIHN